MTFNEYKYQRPNLETIEKEFKKAVEIIENSNDLDEVINTIKHINHVRDDFESMQSLASILNTIDTLDEFYEAEQLFFDENSPLFIGYINEFSKALVACKYVSKLEKEFGKLWFEMIRQSLKTFDISIVNLLQEENKLTTKYTKVVAGAKIEFDGKINNLSQMRIYGESKDRETRKQAEAKVMEFFSENEQELDNIYDSLVKVRTQIAKQLGFENFTKLGYARLGRLDYDDKDVANYRKQVYEDLVPIVNKVYEKKAKLLGIEDLKSYDLGLGFKTGNPTPKGDKAWMVERASKMYHEMSKETGEFFDFMNEHQLMDLEAKAGKAGGGYCTYIPSYKSPFIFANFNGTSGDVEVLTHEAGHAFQVFSSRGFDVPEYRWPTLEACEIHSMSMEFLAWPWMKDFFLDDIDKFKYSHLLGTITFIPYGVLVDEFQHEVYNNPEISVEQRKQIWRKLEKKYLPYKVYDNEMLEKGTDWYRQGHIFQDPFYYIDYTLAQVCAQQFWIKDQESHENAWNDYYRLCCQGGSKSFLELLKVANLKNPFIDGTVKYVVGHLQKWLEAIDEEKIDK